LPRAYAENSDSVLFPLFRLVLSGNHKLGIAAFKAAGFFKAGLFLCILKVIFRFFYGLLVFSVLRAEERGALAHRNQDCFRLLL
jgi:hypothetical protein